MWASQSNTANDFVTFDMELPSSTAGTKLGPVPILTLARVDVERSPPCHRGVGRNLAKRDVAVDLGLLRQPQDPLAHDVLQDLVGTTRDTAPGRRQQPGGDGERRLVARLPGGPPAAEQVDPEARPPLGELSNRQLC